jgi:hypothetical protein
VFYAELNELLTRELAEDGYSGVEVRVTPIRTEIIIRATRTQSVLGEWPLCLAADSCISTSSSRGSRRWFAAGLQQHCKPHSNAAAAQATPLRQYPP